MSTLGDWPLDYFFDPETDPKSGSREPPGTPEVDGGYRPPSGALKKPSAQERLVPHTVERIVKYEVPVDRVIEVPVEREVCLVVRDVGGAGVCLWVLLSFLIWSTQTCGSAG